MVGVDGEEGAKEEVVPTLGMYDVSGHVSAEISIGSGDALLDAKGRNNSMKSTGGLKYLGHLTVVTRPCKISVNSECWQLAVSAVYVPPKTCTVYY